MPVSCQYTKLRTDPTTTGSLVVVVAMSATTTSPSVARCTTTIGCCPGTRREGCTWTSIRYNYMSTFYEDQCMFISGSHLLFMSYHGLQLCLPSFRERNRAVPSFTWTFCVLSIRINRFITTEHSSTKTTAHFTRQFPYSTVTFTRIKTFTSTYP